MATINGSTNSSEWTFKLEAYELTETISIENNTSQVKVDMYLSRANSTTYIGGNWYGSITVEGNAQSISGNIPYPTYIYSNNWYYLGSKTYTVAHNSAGDKIASISSDFHSNDFTPSWAGASGNLTLTTIPRASSVTATNANIGSNTTINITRTSSSFTHTLLYSFGNANGTIVTKTSNTTYNWTVPTSFYYQIPNAKSGTCTITCQTYSGDTLIGSKTTTFVASVSAANAPTISGSVIDSNATTAALTGDNRKLIKYASTAQITYTASAKNGASIKNTTINNITVTSSPYSITNVNTGTFVLKTTDSRGYSATSTLNPTLIDYIPLTMEPTFYRIAATSNKVLLSFHGNYFDDAFSENSPNKLTLKWYYRIKDASNWTLGGTLIEDTDYTISNNSYYSGTGMQESGIELDGNFNYNIAYEFKIEYSDLIIEDSIIKNIFKGQPILWWNNKKVAVSENLEVNKDIKCGDIYSKNLLFLDPAEADITLTNQYYQDYKTRIKITEEMIEKGFSLAYKINIISINTDVTPTVTIGYASNESYGMSNEITNQAFSDSTTGEKEIWVNITPDLLNQNMLDKYLVIRFIRFSNTTSSCHVIINEAQLELGQNNTSYTEHKSYGFNGLIDNYICFDDGTMICKGYIQIGANVNQLRINLPKAFANTAYGVTITNVYSQNINLIWSTSDFHEDYFKAWVVTNSGQTPSFTTEAFYIAMGRWK